LFSPQALAIIEEERQRELAAVPFFDGLVAGELGALVESFAGEPELHHPVRGRIKGARAFEAFVVETNAWFKQRDVSIEEVEHVVADRHGFEEVVLRLQTENGRIGLPVAIVADRRPEGTIEELRLYFASWPLTGRHENRPPVLQPDPTLRQPDVVAEYQRALSAGDVDAIVGTFEPDGSVREPAGGRHVHVGHDALHAFYERLFSNDGGIPLEPCALVDDGRAGALEFNVVRWGKTELPPQAGVVVHVRGQSGKLAAVRMYHDVDPPLETRTAPASDGR
jgi:hypothetical protein